jgi:hypothetical protein
MDDSRHDGEVEAPPLPIVPYSPRELEQLTPNSTAMVQAIAACERVDEVLDIGDKLAALQVYFRQSRDRSNEYACSRLRVRAQRRLGEMLQEMAERGERSRGGKPLRGARVPTLKQLGIDAPTASRAQRLADVAPHKFESILREKRVFTDRYVLKRACPLSEPLTDKDGALSRQHVGRQTIKEVAAVLKLMRIDREALGVIHRALWRFSPDRSAAIDVIARLIAAIHVLTDVNNDDFWERRHRHARLFYPHLPDCHCCTRAGNRASRST